MRASAIVLIGMPGVGKSTIGVLLAKELGMDFVDTDIALQRRCGLRLQDLIEQEGFDEFCRIEEQVILDLHPAERIIATGGSVVYRDKAMRHLKALGSVLWLRASLDELKQRLKNLSSRGIARRPGQSLENLFRERATLYQTYADWTIDTADATPARLVATIVKTVAQTDDR